MLFVQNFLINASVHLSDEDVLLSLKESTGAKYNVFVVDATKGHSLVVLNYCQIESRKTDPIAQECRSLVLEVGTWDIVSRSFNRFFNYGESPCPAVDVTQMTAYEKVDGSLIGLFNYRGEWMYRTRSMIMPENNINAWEVTWKEHIETALGKNFKSRLIGMEHLTYILELTSPENRIVTRYNSTAPQMTLLSIRDNELGHYETRQATLDYVLNGIPEWREPHAYKFETISDCLTAAKELRNLEEGFVLYNRLGEPICKVKNPAYVAAHHLRGEGLNPRRIKDLIFMGEVSEYLAIFPEDEEMFDPYIWAFMRLQQRVNTTMEYLNFEMTQKEFAIRIKDLSYKGLLFTMRKGMTQKEAWAKCNTKTKYSLVDGMMK